MDLERQLWRCLRCQPGCDRLQLQMETQSGTDRGEIIPQTVDVTLLAVDLHDQCSLTVERRHATVLDVDLVSRESLGKLVSNTDPVASQSRQ